MSARELVAELAGVDCRCGAVKERGQTFCKRCYFRLPKHLQTRLYRRVGDGYEEAYSAATEFLDATIPRQSTLRLPQETPQ